MTIINIISGVTTTLLVTLILFLIKRRWRKEIVLLWVYLLLMIIIFSGIQLARMYKRKIVIKNSVETLIHSYIWMAYDPSEFNPLKSKIPSQVSIVKDLKKIKELGFEGIITFNCNDFMNIVPIESKKLGLKVIAGIWDPKSKMEISNAISLQNYIDGYTIGHDGYKKDYSYYDLRECFNIIRNSTFKPVSTTLPIKQYTKEVEIIKMVDWLFPDMCLTFPDSINVDRDVKCITGMTKELDNVNSENKPILLKMVIYPYDTIRNASEINQSNFYSKLLDCIKDNSCTMPSNTSVSFYGLYDPKWKIEPYFYYYEPYTGLVDSLGNPRISLITIMNKIEKIK